MKNKIHYMICFYFAILFVSCHNEYVPKQRQFQRIELQKKKYKMYNGTCPFQFEIPEYAVIIPDTSDKKNNPCWLNVFFTDYNATLHLSYKDLEKNDINKVIEETRKLVYKHTLKAEEIIEIPFQLDSVRSGIRYDLTGETATAYQYYVTDKKKNYLRAALYFNVHTDLDSIEPVFKFLRYDAEHILSTLKWKN